MKSYGDESLQDQVGEEEAEVYVLPASFAQQRLWFQEQFNPGSSLYNMPAAIRLTGRLDVEALEQSMAEIVARHEVLRTTFGTEDGELMQFVADARPMEVPLIDLQGLSADQREAEVERMTAEEGNRGFDLSQGPLLRTKLLRLGEDEHVLLVTMHHIISDGWSHGVFVRELSALYEAYVNGQPSPLEELPIQYADFAEYQMDLLEQNALASQYTYWKKKLGGELTVLQLPTDRPRPSQQTYRGASVPFVIPQTVQEGVRQLSQQEGVTPFMTLLAAFNVLLHRYSGQDDIVVGSPIAGRNREELEGLIGFFVNNLVLRSDLSGNPTFQLFLQQVRQTAIEAYANQDVPFDKLVEELQPERHLSHSPLFQVMFVLQNAPMNELQLPGLTLQVKETERPLAKFDVTMELLETADGLQGRLEYNTDLFDQSTMERLAGHFEVLLAGLVENPHQHIAQLPLLPAGERQQLLVDWNAREWNDNRPENLRGRALHQIFEVQVEKTPDRVAVTYEEVSLTYRELNARANQVAHRLQKLGVGPEIRVGLCVERSIDMMVGLLGILKAGGAYVPIDPKYPKERIQFVLEDAAVPVLLTQSRVMAEGEMTAANVLCLDSDWESIAQESVENLDSGANGDNLAYVIYTSGSTGKPKGVLIPHRNVDRLFAATEHWYRFGEQDVWTMFHSYAFDFSVWEIWGALLYGGRLVIVPYLVSRSPEEFYTLLVKEQVTVLNQTPSAFRQLIQVEEDKGMAPNLALRYVIFGGEALELQALKPWFERHGDQKPQLVNMYGITETTVHVTYRVITAEDVRAGKGSVIGEPIPDLTMYVLDAHLQPVPIGVAGEMYVGGAGLARGYFNRPDLTGDRFIPHPFSADPNAKLYKTGDVARYLVNGDLEYLGRIDNQVKIRGFRIELGEIESTMAQHEAVREAVVLVREDAPGEKRLVGYAVVDEAQGVTASDLREFLKGILPEHMVPSAFVLLDVFPLTGNGKVDRKALPAPDHRPKESEYVAPRDEKEAALAAIWAEILHLEAEEVGIDDNYFELGGDSIRSIKVMSKAREVGLNFTLQQIFQYQTIRELVEQVSEAEGEVAEDFVQTAPFSLISDEDRAKLPEDAVDAYPLSKLQEGMLFHSQLNPDSSVYHNVISARIKAPFNEQALFETVKRVIARHDVLRTSFDLTSYSESMQIVHRETPTTLLIDDLRHLSNEAQEQALDAWFADDIKRHFDYSQAPLVRFHIHRRTDDTFQFAFTEHHVITDGWSVASLLTEFFATYASLMKGEEPPLGEGPTVAYRDFIQLERAALASEEAKGYWESQLSGYTFTKLPRWSTGTPAAKKGPEFRTKDAVVPLATSQKLNDLASLAKAPLKMVLLAAHFKVMSLVSGQSDIVTGVVSNGRVEAADGERVIGLHLNSLPYRLELAGGTWVDLVKQTFDKDREVLPHRRYPMAQVQKDLGGQPLFEALFNYINFHVYESLDEYSELGMLDHREYIYTDLTFNAEFSLSKQGEVQLRLQWDGNEFTDEQVELMAGYYLETFELMAQDPQMRYEQVDLLSAAEWSRLFQGFNNTDKAYAEKELCLHQFFEAQVERTPDAQAVVFEGKSLTYRELNERANQLAHYLQKQGVGPEVLVGISIERSLEMVIGLYAILKAGGAYVPIDPTYPQDRLAYMLEDSAVSVLLTQGHLVAQLPAHQAKTIALDTEWDVIAQESAENLPLRVLPNNLAYMIYTSGSTGKPKGAMNEHRGINNRLLWMQEQFQLTAADRILQKTPFSFDVSVWEFFWPLMVGATLVMARPEGHRDAAYLADLIQAEGITTLHFVPSMLQVFLEEPTASDCTSIRQVMCSGEALPYELQERFFTRFGEQVTLNNLYGPTEAAVDVTFWGCERSSDMAIVPIGRAITNTQIHILDKHLQPAPIGSPGELHIGGVQVARGYHNRPDLTAEKFIADPFRGGEARLYKTGDLARYLPDGTIEYLGRIDFQVKIRGLRIELGEIENALLQHPHIEAAAVLVRQAVDGGQQLFAFYTTDLEDLEVSEIKDFLGASLPDYMVPQTLARLDVIPLSPNGKIDRNKLNALAKEYKVERTEVYVAPVSELQEQIAAIWANVLGVERVGINDNFFDLGGHSLLVMKVYNALKNDLGLDIPMTDLFQYTTVQQLADAIAAKGDEGASAAQTAAKRAVPAKRNDRETDIAIIGMGLRFPDANTPDEFWNNLRQGKESIRRLNPDEVEPIFYNQTAANQSKMVYAGAFLEGIDQFDPEFFGMSEREATLLDPQQRLFLECVWEAMEDACYDPESVEGKVALYAGATPNQYVPLTAWGTGMADMYQAFLGSNANFMATRVSYKLNLRGESMMVSTACSTSLVAVHMACQSLREGKADMAIAGGATVTVPQKTGYLYEPNFIQSPDGHCRAFDKEAEGTVPGNGVGAVFLKRLSDAQRDGDPIYAVIKGSAINNDGNAKIGYTAPSIQGQMEVIAQAQAEAGVEPETITYIEAHGTATKLGDPIEVSALTQVFRQGTDKKQYCAIGSVKTNIGHLDSAAGIAGLIKAALSVYHGEIPPSLHYNEANPHIDFANSPFFVNATLAKWQPENGVRRAGVSAFGIGGTNAHVILEEAPKKEGTL